MKECQQNNSSSEYLNKLKDEILKFRQVGHQFVKKEINTAQFKAASGGMGVYAQKGGEKFMIRLRIPSGVINLPHLKLIAGFARQYKLENIHLTTRQAIQLHDLGIDEVCDIMDTALAHGLYTRGSGGNYPRNVALSPLSGVEEGEAFDVAPYALQVCSYLMERITEYHLPRKLKIAFSNNGRDYAGCTFTDLGFLAVIEDGKPFFKLYLAGGLGANPALGIPLDGLITPEEVLYYVEAVIRVFTKEGDFENKSRARLRYIPQRIGKEAFIESFQEEVNALKAEGILLGDIPVLTEEFIETVTQEELPEEESNCLIPQKQKGLYTVILHPLCGLMPTETLYDILGFIEDCEGADIRLSMSENMYIRNLNLAKAYELLALTKGVRQVLPVQMSVSCIGVPTCQVGIEQSQALCKAILEKLKKKEIPSAYLPAIHISGCTNSCARHQVNELGFAGGKKRVGDAVADVFELYAGGRAGKNTGFGKSYGFLKQEEIPDFIAVLAIKLNESKLSLPDFITFYQTEFEQLVKSYLV